MEGGEKGAGSWAPREDEPHVLLQSQQHLFRGRVRPRLLPVAISGTPMAFKNGTRLTREVRVAIPQDSSLSLLDFPIEPIEVQDGGWVVGATHKKTWNVYSSPKEDGFQVRSRPS